MTKKQLKDKERRQQNNSRGLCRAHPKVPIATTSKVQCQLCLDALKERQDKNNKNGMCAYHKDEPITQGSKTKCKKCVIYGIYKSAKQHAKLNNYFPPDITLEKLTVLYNQKKQCSVKGCVKIDLCLDHDHMTGKVRGWLCNAHNISLGLCNDSPEELIHLYHYIVKHLTIGPPSNKP